MIVVGSCQCRQNMAKGIYGATKAVMRMSGSLETIVRVMGDGCINGDDDSGNDGNIRIVVVNISHP